MDLTLSRVVEAARQRRAAVTAEVGGYIVLLLLQLQASGPRRVAPELVGLTAAGEVELAPSPAAERREVEAALRGLLASLLTLSQSAPPALRATSERSAVGDLAAFEAELTAALIPINHAAARRALARVFRETQKAQRGVSAEQERESSPVPASAGAPQPASARAPQPASARAPAPPSARAPESSSPQPGSVRAIVAKTPVPEPRISAPVLPAVVAEVEAEELEIDVDVDVAVAEDPIVVAAPPEPIAAAKPPEPMVAAAAPPEPMVAAAAPPEPAEPEPALSVLAEVEVDDLDRLLASEPPPTSPVAAPSDAPEALEPLSLVHSLTPAARALTPLAAAGVRRIGSTPPDAARDRAEDALAWVALGEAEPAPQRSDLRDLLDGYLSYTRREEDMTAGLRRMIGLEPWRASGLGSERTGLGQ